MTEWIVRDYASADETRWLRCRVLAFLDTNYYDDVATVKARIAAVEDARGDSDHRRHLTTNVKKRRRCT
ncbi:hypothetical protein [Kribbella steppae]|nr:hypothetical protein [Kribbella steppae]